MAVTFLKKGIESAKAVEQADTEQALRKQQNNTTWRFYLNKGEERSITFVDGDLTPEGLLDIVTFREHTVFMNGNWNNHFVCTQDVEPCPLCEGKDIPSLVGLLTVLDHTPSKSKDGVKTFVDQKRLFVAKKDTIKLLQGYAVKRKGLAGATFDVARVGEKSAAVGTSFDFTSKSPLPELRAKFTQEEIQEDGKTKKVVTKFTPVNYEEEIIYRTAKELNALGFGTFSIGGESAPMDTGSVDYSKEL